MAPTFSHGSNQMPTAPVFHSSHNTIIHEIIVYFHLCHSHPCPVIHHKHCKTSNYSIAIYSHSLETNTPSAASGVEMCGTPAAILQCQAAPALPTDHLLSCLTLVNRLRGSQSETNPNVKETIQRGSRAGMQGTKKTHK